MKVTFIVGTCVERKKAGFGGKNIMQQIPGCIEFYDDKMEGTLRAHSKALKAGVDTGADWVLLMQDDVILANGFYEKAQKRIQEAVSLNMNIKCVQFFRIDPDDKAYRNVTRWRVLPIKNLMWEQANAYRRDIIEEWYKWLWDDGHIEEFPHAPRIRKDGTVYRRDMMPKGTKNRWGHPGQGHDGTWAEWWNEKYPEDLLVITSPNLADHDLSTPSTLGTGQTMYGYMRNSKFFDLDGN